MPPWGNALTHIAVQSPLFIRFLLPSLSSLFPRALPTVVLFNFLRLKSPFDPSDLLHTTHGTSSAQNPHHASRLAPSSPKFLTDGTFTYLWCYSMALLFIFCTLVMGLLSSDHPTGTPFLGFSFTSSFHIK
jgi:hypothetical protein